MTPQYVYGLTRADVRLPEELTGLDGQAVSLVRRGELAAVVSDLTEGRALGTRDDLMAHERVLESLTAAGVTVLPFRFGSALTGREAVEEELLGANTEPLSQALEAVAGRVQLRLRGRYVEDVVLREVIAEDREISALSERLRDVPEDAGYYDRIRLGELIAQALDRRREGDGRTLLEALAPEAEAVRAYRPAREDEVVDAAFLVGQDRREGFEAAVEKIGRDRADHMRLRLIGPLPPYDFVREA